MATQTLIVLILILAAGIFAAVSLAETRGRSWIAWGVVCLSLALLILNFFH